MNTPQHRSLRTGEAPWTWLTVSTGIVTTVLFALLLVSTQADYGETWDEYMYVQVGSQYHQYLFGSGHLPAIYANQLVPSFDDEGLRYYGPFSHIIAILVNQELNEKRRWLSFDLAIHLHLICLFAISGLVMYFSIRSEYGALAACLVVAVYFAFPHLLGHCHNNMGDFPVSAWMVIAAFAVHAAFRRRSYVCLALAGLLTGAALASKVQAVLLGPIFLLYGLLFVSLSQQAEESRRTRLQLALLGGGLHALVALGTMVLLWPWLWDAPFGRFVEVLQRFRHSTFWTHPVFYKGSLYSANEMPLDYAPFYALVTTPLVWLPFAAIGLVRAVSDLRHRQLLPILVALGVLVPIATVIASVTPVFDGVRQFLPAFAFLAAVVGFGMEWTIRLAGGRVWLRTGAMAVVGLAVVTVIIQDIRIHPYQSTYFNALVGGGRGAMGRFELDYWGNSLKEAGRYVNEHAPAGSKVHVVASLERLAKLRPDLVVTATAPDYVIVLNRESLFANPYKNQSPIYVVEADGAVLSRVYHLTAERPM